jgi:hypothetical protein
MRLRERFYLASLLWAALLILPASAMQAADADLDGKAKSLDRGATSREERSAFDTKFGIPNAAPYNTLARGQALVLFSLCGTNTACQTEALNDRKAHMGWGKVAKDLQKKGLTTDDKVGEAIRRVTDAHRDSVAKADSPKTEKLEKAGKAEKMEKIEHIERPMRPERPGR